MQEPLTAIAAVERLSLAAASLAAAATPQALDQLLATNAAGLAGVRCAVVCRDGQVVARCGPGGGDGVPTAAIPLEPGATLHLGDAQESPDDFGRRAAALLGLHAAHLRYLLLARQRVAQEAQRTGMAEMAASILHNVGNVLNSVVVVSEELTRRAAHSRTDQLAAALDLLQRQPDPLRFLREDQRGRLMLPLLHGLGQALVAERRQDHDDGAQLLRHLAHIRSVIGAQQLHSARMFSNRGSRESVDLATLVEDALTISLPDHGALGIRIVREGPDSLPWEGEPHRVLQILTNLLTNAKHALHDQGAERLIRVCLGSGAGQATLAVHDNGCGLSGEQLGRLFTFGYTTREDGHGFGLHSCRINAEFLGGVLHASSAGPGQGATFTLVLPLTCGQERAA